MSLYKSAQLNYADDVEEFGNEDEVVLYDTRPSAHDVIEMHQPEEAQFSFKLSPLPGSTVDHSVIEVSSDDPVETKEEPKQIEVKDIWDWQSKGLPAFLDWVKERFSSIPAHNGETVGVERVISYLKRMNNEISKAISSDYDGKVSVKLLEEARKEIYSAIDRLEEYLEKNHKSSKKKSAASPSTEIVKEGGKSPHVGGIIITVPLLISRMARVCINGMVSAGHDINDVFAKQVKEYDLSKREQAELAQLIEDMTGQPIQLRDRGYPIGAKFDPTSSDNMDLAANYPA